LKREIKELAKKKFKLTPGGGHLRRQEVTPQEVALLVIVVVLLLLLIVVVIVKAGSDIVGKIDPGVIVFVLENGRILFFGLLRGRKALDVVEVGNRAVGFIVGHLKSNTFSM
jgi:hypothetical protein